MIKFIPKTTKYFRSPGKSYLLTKKKENDMVVTRLSRYYFVKKDKRIPDSSKLYTPLLTIITNENEKQEN